MANTRSAAKQARGAIRRRTLNRIQISTVRTSEKKIRALAKAGKTAVIPPKSNRKNPADYDKELYQDRHLIENFFCTLKDFRAIATRYDKLANSFLSGVFLASTLIWLN